MRTFRSNMTSVILTYDRTTLDAEFYPVRIYIFYTFKANYADQIVSRSLFIEMKLVTAGNNGSIII